MTIATRKLGHTISARVSAAIGVLPKNVSVSRNVLEQQMSSALRLFDRNIAIEPARRAADKTVYRKLKQIVGAAKKLSALLNDDAVEMGRLVTLNDRIAHERLDLVQHLLSPELDPAAPVRRLLPALIQEYEAAIATPRQDVKKHKAWADLVVALGKLFEDATGAPILHPGNDQITATISGDFVSFIRAATKGIGPIKSDEGLRHQIRDAIDAGAIGQKKVTSRLCRKAAHAPNCAVTETNKVTDRERKATRSP